MNGRFEEALTGLINSQASLNSAQATLISNQALFVEYAARADQRFARIEQELSEIRAILAEHERILKALTETISRLPETICQKIGFRPRVGGQPAPRGQASHADSRFFSPFFSTSRQARLSLPPVSSLILKSGQFCSV